jgi:hypothetical protein
MNAIFRIPSLRVAVHLLAWCTAGAGAAGLCVSFRFLASSHRLDVVAGAAGFVAGAVLLAAGLISITWFLRSPARWESLPAETDGAIGTMADVPAEVERWINYFIRNHTNRAEPDWGAPIALAADVVTTLVRSLEQFQLGDGGGPAYLIAADRERFLAEGPGTRRLVDLWFAEEREHSRLLGAAVARFGGQRIRSHWSFAAFCLTRRWFGVRFELTVLLLTEIASTVYYRLLLRHGADAALCSMCQLILRDEHGHIAFHRSRLARAARAGRTSHGLLWACWFRMLGLAAATVLWISHAPALRAVGARRAEFYREVWQELSSFIRRLRRESSAFFAECFASPVYNRAKG